MCLWAIHVDVWQKATQYVIILQLKIKYKLKNPKHNIVDQLDSSKHFSKNIPTGNEFCRDYPDEFPVSS